MLELRHTPRRCISNSSNSAVADAAVVKRRCCRQHCCSATSSSSFSTSLQQPQQQQQELVIQPQQPQSSSHSADAKQPSRNNRHSSSLLPDPALVAHIKGCHSWDDCLQLLQCHGTQLDAMLISTLCTHTVYLLQLQQYHDSLAQHENQQQQQQQPARLQPSATDQPSPSSSSSNKGNGRRRRGAVAAESSSCSVPDATAQAAAAYEEYMLQLSGVALTRACSGTFRPQQYTNVLYCFARCSYSLPTAWMQRYLAQAQRHLQVFLPRDFAQLIWATATLQKLSEGPALSSAFVAAFLSASGASLPRFKPIDLANTLWGLATLGVQPPRRWLACALAAAARCWSSFQPFELSISVWALAKLGVCFRGQGGSGQQQQQHMRQWQQRSGSSTQSVAPGDSAAAGASAAAVAGWVGGGGNGPAQASLHESGFGWLLGSISLLMPAMGLQEVANLLWGLAVGRAVLSQLQVQALGNQACIILAQSMSPMQPFTASLTVCLWSLAQLHWKPTLPQAQILVRLLQQALCWEGLDRRHASVLVCSLGRLQLRPPQAAMQWLMQGLVLGLHEAGMADILQVLTGCKRLGWRVSKPWWRHFYDGSRSALQEGSAAELVHLLGTIASLKPTKPPSGWWEVFWDSMGVELEAALAARGLTHIADTRKLPKGSVSIAAGVLKNKAQQQARAAAATRRRQQQQLARQQLSQQQEEPGSCDGTTAADGVLSAAAAGSIGSSTNTPSWDASGWQQSAATHSSDGSSSSGWHPDPFAWLYMQEALQIVTNLQDVTRQHGHGMDAAASSSLTVQRAAVLLWASARLKRMPPKPLLWQLLLLVLTDVHALSPDHLAVALWATAHLRRTFGTDQVECFRLIQPLALAAQWRLLVGLAGSRCSVNKQQRRRVAVALRYLASQSSGLMSIMLLHECSR